MINIKKIYEKEKIINLEFRKRYDYNNLDIFYKQVLQLNVEISELAYETKCFKYWKDETASPLKILLSEYADCLMIILCFCDLKSIEINKIVEQDENDITRVFIKLFYLSSQITFDSDEKIFLEILSYLLKIPELLNIDYKDVEKYCEDKMKLTLANIKVNFNKKD